MIRPAAPWPHDEDEMKLAKHPMFDVATDKVLKGHATYEDAGLTSDLFWDQIRNVLANMKK